jgi:hypothetical protein
VETGIHVGTGPAGTYEVRGIVSSATCIGFEGFVSRRHAFGAPRVLTIGAGTSNLLASELCAADAEGRFREPGYHLRVSLAEPVGSSGWVLLEGAYLREAAASAYVRTGWQARMGAAWEATRGVTLGAALAPARSDPAGAVALACAVHGECGPEARDPATLLPVQGWLEWSRPARRAALGPPAPGPSWANPPRPAWVPGARVDAAAAPAGERFARALGEASLVRIAGRAQFGGRLRAGLLTGADGAAPPHLRLFGGGPRGVRGAGINQLGPRFLVLRAGAEPPAGFAGIDPTTVRVQAAGGDRLVEATLEARWWATRRTQLAAFVDAGTVRTKGAGGAPLAGVRTEGMVSPGLGVLALTPAGALRLDLALDASPARTMPLLRAVEGGGYEVVRTVRWAPREGWRNRLRLQIGMGLPF